MTTNVVPTLGDITLLKNPSDIIAYQLNFFAAVPKDMSSLFYEEIESLPELASRYGDNKDLMKTNTQTALLKIFTRIFGSGTTAVSVTTEDIDTIKYNLVISVTVNVSGILYALSRNVSIDTEGRLSIIQLTED